MRIADYGLRLALRPRYSYRSYRQTLASSVPIDLKRPIPYISEHDTGYVTHHGELVFWYYFKEKGLCINGIYIYGHQLDMSLQDLCLLAKQKFTELKSINLIK